MENCVEAALSFLEIEWIEYLYFVFLSIYKVRFRPVFQDPVTITDVNLIEINEEMGELSDKQIYVQIEYLSQGI